MLCSAECARNSPRPLLVPLADLTSLTPPLLTSARLCTPYEQPREPDYDSYLSKLQGQIAARQARLQQIRLRERRANALFITYGLGLWVLYAVLWYFGIVGVSGEEDWPTRAARGAPVIGGPVA